MTRVLITGATGFVGQHLLDELTDTNLSIRILTRQTNPVFWTQNKNFKIHHGDISDLAVLDKAVENVDIIINLAAELKNNNKFSSTNIKGTENLINLSKKYNVKKIIHLSSVGVVGMQYSLEPVIVTEEKTCLPKNEYERTKLEAERLFLSSEIPTIVLRPTNVFGEHHPNNVLLNFFQYVKTNKLIILNKNSYVNYLYVKDLANIIKFFIENNTNKQIFNVGKTLYFKDFISYINDIMQVRSPILYVPKRLFYLLETVNYLGRENLKLKLRAVSNQVQYSDDKLKSIVPYKYNLAKGLYNTIQYYKDIKQL